MKWYVLFTFTGREEKAEHILKKRLDTDLYTPFIPMAETVFKTAGVIKKELKPFLPGYIFIETNASSQEIIDDMRDIFYDFKEIIRFIHYEDKSDIAMREHEREMMLRLFNDDNYVEASSGIIIGDHVYVKEGPLIGLESVIRKIDRHKRRAIIELEFMGAVRQFSVALEIVEKI